MRRSRKLCARFEEDRSGTVAIIFSLSLVLLCMTTGLAIDASRAYAISSKIAAVIDAAALSAAKSLDGYNATDAEVRSRARAVFDAHTTNMVVTDVAFTNFIVTADRSNYSISISVDVDVPTSFGQLAGVPRFQFTKSALAVYARRPIELAMVLDVTGSMNDFGKLSAMKSATKDVINTIIDSAASRSKIGLAPFSAAVNVGSFLSSVANGQSIFRDTCVIERPGGAGQDDRAPVGTARANVMTSSRPDDDDDRYHYVCPAARVVPLTNDASSLRAAVDSYTATGWTAGHMGTAWGWYLLSPEWSGVWGFSPAPYNAESVVKAALIMTDGVFNTSYKSGSAQSVSAQTAESYDQFATLCRNMKDKGILVYTVGFALSLEPEPGRTQALNALRSCATSADYFFDADTSSQLAAAFQSIADRLNNLRIKS